MRYDIVLRIPHDDAGRTPRGWEVAVMAASRGGKELARRKAALERAASRMAEEWREAEEAEAQRRRADAEFDELVADFELAREDEAAVVVAEVEQGVRQVKERGQARIDGARRVVAAMYGMTFSSLTSEVIAV